MSEPSGSDDIETARQQQAGRGREADEPHQIPLRGWGDVLWRVGHELMDHHAPLMSAGIAFYALLTVVPTLVVVVSVYGLLADPSDVAKLIGSLSPILPRSARPIVSEQLRMIVDAAPSQLSAGLVVSFLLSMFSASSGAHALLDGINLAYNEKDPPYLRVRARAFLYTLSLVVAVPLGLAAIAGFDAALRLLNVDPNTREFWVTLRWLSLAAFGVLGMTVLYGRAPTRRRSRLTWRIWGAVAATALWLGVSVVFSALVESVGTFNRTYGTLAGVIVLMLWFYFTTFSVLFGAELNSELEQQTTRDTTVGPPLPLGERGAYSADHVGPSWTEGWHTHGDEERR